MRLAERFHVPAHPRDDEHDHVPHPRPPGRTTLVEELLAHELAREPEPGEHHHLADHAAPGEDHAAHLAEPTLDEGELIEVEVDREPHPDGGRDGDRVRTPSRAERADHHDDEEAHDRHTKHAKHKPKHVRGERITEHAHAFFAERDRYNKPSIRSNRARKRNQIPRPGVRVNHRDSFRLAHRSAHRYRIVSGHRAVTMDLVTADQIAEGHRLALNPKHTRRLELPDGSHELCVFTWVGSAGSGWLPLKALRGDHHAIKQAVNAKANEWAPARLGERDLRSVKRYVFIDAESEPGRFRSAMAQGDRDRATFIQPRARVTHEHPKGRGNHTSDYLEHTDRDDGMGGTRDYINVNMNLPAHHAPPVAIETAVPGDAFFVPTAGTFHREVAIFGPGASATRRRQMWVYGYLGKQAPDGSIVPDPKRRGWVPLRVIKRA